MPPRIAHAIDGSGHGFGPNPPRGRGQGSGPRPSLDASVHRGSDSGQGTRLNPSLGRGQGSDLRPLSHASAHRDNDSGQGSCPNPSCSRGQGSGPNPHVPNTLILLVSAVKEWERLERDEFDKMRCRLGVDDPDNSDLENHVPLYPSLGFGQGLGLYPSPGKMQLVTCKRACGAQAPSTPNAFTLAAPPVTPLGMQLVRAPRGCRSGGREVVAWARGAHKATEFDATKGYPGEGPASVWYRLQQWPRIGSGQGR